MIDLDAVEARAERIRLGRPFKIDPIHHLVEEDVPALLAELRAARAVVEAVGQPTGPGWLDRVRAARATYDQAVTP